LVEIHRPAELDLVIVVVALTRRRIDLPSPLALPALTALAALKRRRDILLAPLDTIAPIAHAPFGSSTVGRGQSFYSRTTCLAHDMPTFGKKRPNSTLRKYTPCFPLTPICPPTNHTCPIGRKRCIAQGP